MLTYLRFDVGALVREYRLLAAVRGRGLTPFSVLKRFYVDRFEAAPLLLLTSLIATGTPFRRRIALGVAALLATTAGTLLLLTNTQLQGLPLLAAVALLLSINYHLGARRKTERRAGSLCCASDC
jgi:hypothetical protein